MDTPDIPDISDISDISDIPPFDKFDDYRECVIELARKHRELGSLVAVEKEGRVTNYYLSDERSVSGRDRDAEFQTLNLTTDIIRLKADIAALETFKGFYETWLTADVKYRYS